MQCFPRKLAFRREQPARRHRWMRHVCCTEWHTWSTRNPFAKSWINRGVLLHWGYTVTAFTMIPRQIVESISVTDLPSYVEESAVAYCDLEQHNHCKASVTFGPGLAPVSYRSAIICYDNSTRKRFISKVNYETRMRPKKFGETVYVRPKDAEKSYVSFLDYHCDEQQRWYKTAVTYDPRSVDASGAVTNGPRKCSSVDMFISDSQEYLDANHNKGGKLVNGYHGNLGFPERIMSPALASHHDNSSDHNWHLKSPGLVMKSGLASKPSSLSRSTDALADSDYAFRSGPFFYDGQRGKRTKSPVDQYFSHSMSSLDRLNGNFTYINGHDSYRAELDDNVSILW